MSDTNSRRLRLLLINPNVTAAITERMAAEARAAASPGVEIVTATASFGAQYVENRVEAAIAAHAVLEVLAERAAGCDAAIVAAYGDPGLAAARELASIPVVGPTEASLIAAWPLAQRFSIVCMTARLGRWYAEAAAEHGLAARLASVRPYEGAVADVTRAKEELAEPIMALALRCVEEDGAEAVIFGGGPLAGLARELADRLPVPVLDGVACAVRLAEALVGLGLGKASRGGFAAPGPKPTKGLSPALARVFE